MERITRYLPHWLAWPINLLSIAAALAGAGLILYGSGFGDADPAYFVWGGGAFVAAAAFWWIADLAAANRRF